MNNKKELRAAYDIIEFDVYLTIIRFDIDSN